MVLHHFRNARNHIDVYFKYEIKDLSSYQIVGGKKLAKVSAFIPAW